MIPFNQSSTSQPIPPSHTSSIAPDLATQQPPPPHPPPLPPPTLSHPPPPPPPPPPPSQQQHPSCIHHQQQQQQQQHPVPMHLSVNLPPHPEHLWNPDTNPPATASDNSSQHLQPQHHPVPSYDASPYSLAHTDKTNLYHHHPLAVIPPHVQQPQPSPSTHPNYIYPVHNHLVTPVAHVPIGAAHYAHLPSSIWTSPHGQYHPPPLPSTPRPPTNLSQLHPAQVHPNPQHYTLPLPDPSNPTTLSHSNLHHPVMHQSPHPQFTYSYSHIPPTPPQYMEDVYAHPPPQNMPVQYALSSSHLPTLVNQPLPLKNFDQINTHQQNPVVQTSAVPSKSNSPSVPSHLPSIPTSNHPKSSPHSQHLEASSLDMENKDTHPPPSSSTQSSKTAEATERSLPENTSSPRKRKSHLSLQDQDLATNATSSSNHETPDKLSPSQKLKSAPVIKGQLLRKPRKPYTITKSREVWTKDEHSRFLTALQMFDRDWKKIEAYIGTKTVLQIRSHAQKHFGKVAKYNTGEYIPPPRPKKRAVLPYPRSRSTTPSKAAIVSIANGMCASASGNGSASDGGTGSDDDNPERSLQASLTVNEEDNDKLLERDPDRSDMEQPMSTAPKFTKYKKGGLSANESKESDAKSNGDISDVEMYQHDGRTNVTLVTQRSKVSVLTTKDPEKLCESLVDRSDSENGYEKKTDNRRKDVAIDSSRNIQDHKLYNKNDGKVDSTPDVTVEVSRKREVISMAVGSAVDVYSRVQTEGDCSRDEKLIDAGLLEANYPLLVLSNCVDMMSREKGESPINKQSQDVTSRHPRLKKPRLQKLSFSSKNKIAMLATCNNNDELQRRRLPSSPNRSNESLMEDSTEEKESRDFRCRQNTSNEDSSRGRSPPVVTDEDDEKVDGQNCPQQSSTGSGSFSDDAIAGFSNSDVGMGSSCGGSRRGSTDNSDSGDGDEDPKSSNEGSRVGAVLNTPSRDSSPLDPNSSLSRENSPNNDELIDGVNGVNEIQRRNGPVAHVRNQNSCLRFNECAVGGRHERRPSWCDSEKEIREAIESEEHRRMININELDSDMKNRGKTCDEKDNSRFNTRLGNNDDKSDGPRIFFHLENNAKDSGHLLTNKTVTPGVPVTKGIANLINVSDSQMNGNCMLHQEKNKSRMETNKDAFANKNRESTIETCSECDNRKRQSSLRNVERRSPSR